MRTLSSSRTRFKADEEEEDDGTVGIETQRSSGMSNKNTFKPSLSLKLAASLNNPAATTTLSSYAVILALALCINPVGANIDCFKCVSLNGNNPSCEDPFHNNYSSSILESPCMGGRKGRNGVFPATACIKLAGYYDDTGETITVRGCALDSGTLTTDTEIIRMSHCGSFWYDDRYVKGCLQSCHDFDGCNGSPRHHHQCSSNLSLLTLLLLSTTLHLAIKLVIFSPSSESESRS